MAGYRGMDTTQAASLATGVVATDASTQKQWTKTNGGVLLVWISGRVPSGGFTLAGTMTFNLWASESGNPANAGVRARVFKYSGGSESEVAGGPWTFGAPTELTTTMAVKNWNGTPTSTAFAENDRLVVKYYITNVGTMGSGQTCTMDYNAGTGVDGDSYFQINETVTFKAEDLPKARGMLLGIG